jgi:hypothetical protein
VSLPDDGVERLRGVAEPVALKGKSVPNEGKSLAAEARIGSDPSEIACNGSVIGSDLSEIADNGSVIASELRKIADNGSMHRFRTK